MVLKIATKEGWAYYDNIEGLEVSGVLYKWEPMKESPEGGESKYPQFFTHDKSLLYPNDIHLVNKVVMEGTTPPEYEHGRYARWVLSDSEIKRVAFDGEAYLLNNDGKTVDRFHQ